MPQDLQETARALGIESKSILLEVLKLNNPHQMLLLLQDISSQGLGRAAVRAEIKRRLAKKGRAKATRSKPYTFQFRAPDKRYRLSLSFRQSTVEPEDLIRALEEALERLRAEARSRDRSLES